MRTALVLGFLVACGAGGGGNTGPDGGDDGGEPDGSGPDGSATADAPPGAPTAAELLARIASCDQIVGGMFAPDTGAPSDI